MACEDPTSETIEWFRSNFSHAEKDGRINLKDFKHASHRNCHVSFLSYEITCTDATMEVEMESHKSALVIDSV
jgi:hypothetical protein